MLRTGCQVVVILLAGAHVAAAQELRQQQIGTLNQALRAFDEAAASTSPVQARKLYRRAADLFEELVAGGLRNGKLYYNLGNTYLRLGDLGRAMLNYRRADTLIPGDANLKANMRFARSLCATPIPGTGERKLVHSLLFWHFETSQPARARVGIVSFSLAWALLAVRLFSGWRWPRNAALVCGVLAIVLGASVAVRSYYEYHRREGVLIAPETIVRKGNGTSYEQQFNEPLDAGVEFTILETRPDATGTSWHRVAFPNGIQGWVPAAAAEVI